MSVREEIGPAKTAFVFAGGGSFGAIQVGMLHSLAAHGVAADMVVGSSVGALNGGPGPLRCTAKATGLLKPPTIFSSRRHFREYRSVYRVALVPAVGLS